EEIAEQGAAERAGIGAEGAGELVDEVSVERGLVPAQPVGEPRGADAGAEVADDPLLHQPEPVDAVAEPPVQEHPFADPAGRVPEPHRRAGGESNKINAAKRGGAHRLREHRDAVSVPLRLTAGELAQAIEVLAGDLAVGADVHDRHRAIGGLAQVRDGAGGDALGDEGLAEPHLVGDKEAVDGILIGPETAEGVVDGGALEGFEAGEERVDVHGSRLGGSGRRHARLLARVKSKTVFHIFWNSGGISCSEFGISRTLLTCCSTVRIRSMSFPAARTRGSNSTIGGGGLRWFVAVMPSIALARVSSSGSWA